MGPTWKPQNWTQTILQPSRREGKEKKTIDGTPHHGYDISPELSVHRAEVMGQNSTFPAGETGTHKQNQELGQRSIHLLRTKPVLIVTI